MPSLSRTLRPGAVISASRKTPKVELRVAGKKGIGVFALEPIPRGAQITPCVGVVVRTADLTPELWALQVGGDLWICSEGDALDDAINHSCEPNIGFLTGDPVFYALRDIGRGEELCWDYSTSLTERGWKLHCACESAQCRGVILPFGQLCQQDQQRLVRISLGYIRERWRRRLDN